MWLTRRFFLNFLSIDVRLCLTGWGVGGANHVAKLLRHHLAPCSGNAALKAAGICWQALRAEAGKRQIGGWKSGEKRIQTSLSSHQPRALQVMGLGKDIPIEKGAGGEVEVVRRCINIIPALKRHFSLAQLCPG